jgi:hypothetical protein
MRRHAGKIVIGVLILLLAWIALTFVVRAVRPSVGHKYQEGMTGQVEREVHAAARSEGQVTKVRCQRVASDAWNCRVRFVDGRIVLQRAVWYASQQTLGISIVQRKQPISGHPLP